MTLPHLTWLIIPDNLLGHREYLKPSDTHTVCGWKGTASYYTVDVNGKQLKVLFQYDAVIKIYCNIRGFESIPLVTCAC